MGIILQFPGGKKCRDCGQQINPHFARQAPHVIHCDQCLDAKSKVNENFAKSMRLTMDDIAKIMGYNLPR